MGADVLVEGRRWSPWRTGLTRLGVRRRKDDRCLGQIRAPGGGSMSTPTGASFGGTFASDNFETGTRAAAWGGTTTIIDFAVQTKGGSAMEGYESWREKADGKVAIDYGLHMITGDINEQTLKEMDVLVDEGVTSFKLFMAYPGVFYSDDGEILLAMQKAAENGSTICMHAENGIAIDVYVEQALKRGQTDRLYHGLVRKSLLEGEAAHRAIVLAELTGAPLYIVHTSAKEAVNEVIQARDRGLNVFAETCPQYLFFDLDNLGNGFEGAKYVCSPRCETGPRVIRTPLARAADQRISRWCPTDHCPFCFNDHPELGRQKRLGEEDFSKIPNGMPGVEPRLEVLFEGGVNQGRTGVNRFVEITATTPAKMFGMYPKKGRSPWARTPTS